MMRYNGGCISNRHQCSSIARHSHSARSMGMLVNKATQAQRCSQAGYSVLMNTAAGTQTRGHRVRSVQEPSQGKEEGEQVAAAAAAGDDDDAMGRSTDKDVGSTVVEGNGDAVAMDSVQQQKIGGINAASKGVAEEESLFQGVLEEVGLIQWPTLSGALVNTLLVIGIVFGTSLVLLAVNTGLAELSRDIYSKL